MVSLKQPLLAEEGEVEWQRHVDISPLRVSTPSGGGSGQGAPAAQEPTDKAWAVAFKMNVVITIISAVHFHKTALTLLGSMLESLEWHWPEGRSLGVAILLACFFVVPCTCWLLTIVLLVISRCSALIPQEFSFGVFVLACSLAATGLANSGAVLGVAGLAIACAVISYAFVSRGGHIEFTAAVLKAAVLVVSSTPQITCLALCMMAVRTLSPVIAAMASFGSVLAFQTVLAPDGATYRAVDCRTIDMMASTLLICECNGNVISDTSGCEYSRPNVILVSFWVASVGWNIAVTANVVAATVSASVGARWSSSSGDVRTVWGSFRRVMHSSLGSISKASMITALFSPLHSVVGHLLLLPASAMFCSLFCVRLAVMYMVENTVSFIGMYHLSFSEAVPRAWTLFREYGHALFFNEAALAMGLLVFGLSGFAIASLSIVLYLAPLSPSPGVVVAVIYGAGTLTIITTIEVVIWAFKTIYICFSQDLEAFSASHDRCPYDGMYMAWRKLQLPHPMMAEQQGDIIV